MTLLIPDVFPAFYVIQFMGSRAYFLARERSANRSTLKGLQVKWDEGKRKPEKARNATMIIPAVGETLGYLPIKESDIPSAVIARFNEKL